jgi:hypothetical protein
VKGQRLDRHEHVPTTTIKQGAVNVDELDELMAAHARHLDDVLDRIDRNLDRITAPIWFYAHYRARKL